MIGCDNDAIDFKPLIHLPSMKDAIRTQKNDENWWLKLDNSEQSLKIENWIKCSVVKDLNEKTCRMTGLFEYHVRDSNP